MYVFVFVYPLSLSVRVFIEVADPYIRGYYKRSLLLK